MSNVQRLKQRLFANNPDVENAYQEMSEEFAMVDTLISMRQEAGLTQEDVAKRMGTQKSNISRLERGGNPSWATLQKYAEACGMTLSLGFKKASFH